MKCQAFFSDFDNFLCSAINGVSPKCQKIGSNIKNFGIFADNMRAGGEKKLQAGKRIIFS
jgi:hypothetical protein